MDEGDDQMLLPAGIARLAAAMEELVAEATARRRSGEEEKEEEAERGSASVDSALVNAT